MLTYRLTRTIAAEFLRISGPTASPRPKDWATYRPVCCVPRRFRFQPPSAQGQQHRCLATAAPQATHMDDTLTKYIQHIHDAPMQGVFYATGGGMQVCHSQAVLESVLTLTQHSMKLATLLQALTWLLTVPGASRTVLESRVPYAQYAMEALLQQATVSYASVEAAQQLAKAAYSQAAQLSQLGTPIVGVGCTCALMTDRIKKGDHKVCLIVPCAQLNTPLLQTKCFAFLFATDAVLQCLRKTGTGLSRKKWLTCIIVMSVTAISLCSVKE